MKAGVAAVAHCCACHHSCCGFMRPLPSCCSQDCQHCDATAFTLSAFPWCADVACPCCRGCVRAAVPHCLKALWAACLPALHLAPPSASFLQSSPCLTALLPQLLLSASCEHALPGICIGPAVKAGTPALTCTYQCTAEALKAGKHVVVDKPMALSPQEGRCMLRAAQQSPNLVSSHC